MVRAVGEADDKKETAGGSVVIGVSWYRKK